jgi:hypothetical protein
MAMTTGNFSKAVEGRMTKNLKVPSEKAKELFSSMIRHGSKRQEKGKANS